MKLDILVPIHTYPDGNADKFALHVAAAAKQLGADVHALVLNADFPRVSSALGNMLLDVPALIGGAKAKCRERGSSVIQAVEREMGPLGIPLRTTQTECFPGAAGDVVNGFARYHDLVLVGIGASDVTPQATAEAAIFGSGRPTLLVPEDAPPATFGHVMIAWDGSRVAARAVSDARDFLQRAQTITIASVTDEKALPDEDLGGRLAEYLSRHDIEATVAQVQSRGRPIAETLQEHAREIGAGMLVMGGFGHSRMRDFVLGGATSGILKDLRLPVLLSH
ncbi:universal stress protein [Bradyrhizobium viridifuturi]|jgi:nucleotide-binding universal stress UspA family protein|nr:universal stress protein [Bradyrhizobium viridifuturi]MBR1048625.1 universal stress protein [Bradyrhizobium viridifuturi]MBR1083728.1 universal stress protein [Bradyrhizobium viridifuturi]MBR1099192.1 universal stress protein [Bradyrhizobium viridifuturi]MBR1106348.1 universal stress protein [Bradyrhizobium viridifuturi]